MMDFQVKLKHFQAHAAITESSQLLWHERCAHINMDYLNKSIMKGAILWIDYEMKQPHQPCEYCLTGKMSSQPYKSVPRRQYKVGEMAHVDLAGKFPVKSVGRSEYFRFINDEASGYRTVYFLKQKTEPRSSSRITSDSWRGK